jgi:ribonuclease D
MFGDTPLVYVDTLEGVAAAAEALSRAPVIGVDTEADSFHHYQEKVCLLQISDLDTDYVIDPLAVRDLSALGPIFANPEQVKVFHGADYDVVSLKRDFGFTFRNIFDTMVASQFAGIPRFGLADLIERWFGFTVDKKYQRHDWAERPLRDEHLFYARGDTHFLPALREILLRRLEQAGRLDPVIEECAILEERQWQGRVKDPADYLRVKGARQLDGDSQRVLRALYRWRDREGKSLDRPVFKVIPDPVLIEIAVAKPASTEELGRMLRSGSPLFRRFGTGLAAAVAEGVADTSPLPEAAVREPMERVDSPLSLREQERLMQRLKDWRNEITREGPESSVTVVSNSVLKDIARAAPRTLEELAAVPDVRKWQVAMWGPQLLEQIVDELSSVEPRPADDSGKPRRRRRRRRPGAPTEE